MRGPGNARGAGKADPFDPCPSNPPWFRRSIPFHELTDERRRRGGKRPAIVHHPARQGDEVQVVRAEPNTPAAAEDIARLESVIHDFLACLDKVDVKSPVEGNGTANLERFLRILDHRPPPGAPVLGPPVLCGVSPPVGLEGLFGYLASTRRTGTLRVTARGATYMISVVGGDVVHAISDPRPDRELIGNLLVGHGLLDADDLGRFFQAWGQSGCRIGEGLNGEHLVAVEGLREALELQLHHLFDRLLAEPACDWCFHEGEATLSYINVRMNATSVLLQSARKRDEAPGG